MGQSLGREGDTFQEICDLAEYISGKEVCCLLERDTGPLPKAERVWRVWRFSVLKHALRCLHHNSQGADSFLSKS